MVMGKVSVKDIVVETMRDEPALVSQELRALHSHVNKPKSKAKKKKRKKK
jgi:hypothetical protein